jgi:glutamyl-tRNA synthetase
MASSYIGRIAPSPTGLLHLGHARTFWLAYQRALAANGTLLMRMDDLDPHRSRPEFTAAALEDLAWLGIRWQQPVIYQSRRLPLYRAALAQLLSQGDAYPCTCSRRELASAALAPHDEDDEPIYPGKCRLSSPTSVPLSENKNSTYRFRIPTTNPISFTDLALGPQSFTPQHDFGDFLLWSRDGLPSYQLATVVDDAALGVTEVVRGADLLRSTARQILLQRALSLPTPAWFHCPLVRDTAGRRLAKRHDALSLRTLRQSGHTPAELIAGFDNTLA